MRKRKSIAPISNRLKQVRSELILKLGLIYKNNRTESEFWSKLSMTKSGESKYLFNDYFNICMIKLASFFHYFIFFLSFCFFFFSFSFFFSFCCCKDYHLEFPTVGDILFQMKILANIKEKEI